MSPMDNLWITRRALRSKSVDNSQMLDLFLTSSVRSPAVSERLKAYCSRVRTHLTPALCLLLGVIGLQTNTAQATPIDQYKLYSHSRIVDYKQFTCFVELIHKESSWSPLARNGSHYGLGQMRSTHYRNLDPYRQIDATLKYIKGRYKTVCKALAFHKRNGYY
jgi:hypothetical protein